MNTGLGFVARERFVLSRRHNRIAHNHTSKHTKKKARALS